MATIITQQPDALSFSQNLKKFIVSTEVSIPVQLVMGATQIFDLTYAPGVGGLVEIDLRQIIDKLLSIGVPTDNDVLTEQTLGVSDFTATIDSQNITFRVLKGGVAELQSNATAFLDANLLSWQPQTKQILQVAPEWIGVYPTAARNIRVKAYFADGTDETILYAEPTVDKLWSLNVSWYCINEELTTKNPVAWDVWMEDDGGTRLSYIQRYQLRNAASEETLYLWCNTLGGIDSFSMTGYLEDDKKLEHKISELIDESLDEYWTDRNRELKQSTGYLTLEENRWLEDFFISSVRYRVRMDGAIKRIVITESKVLSSTVDDQFDFEFTYRYADDPALLNLDRTLDPLPAPEGLADFFLAELLSGLTTALYAGNLLLAVQSPFAQGWQKLSFSELWEQALPTLVDNDTIKFIDGKLRTQLGAVNNSRKPKHGFEVAADSVLSFNNSTREFTITAKLGETEIPVWNMGSLLTKLTESISIANTVGTWHVYYKDVLQEDQTLLSTLMATLDSWDRNKDLPIAKITWNGSEGTVEDYRYVYTEVNHSPLVRFEDKAHPAEDIYNDTDNFTGLLNEEDTTVQKALEKLDKIDNWKPKHGFETPNTSSLDFNDGLLTFSITAQGVTEFPVWNMGQELLKATETIAISNAPGWWYVYYANDPTTGNNILKATATSWDRNKDIPIAIIDWTGASGTLKDYRYLYTEINHTPLVRIQDKAHPAEDIYNDSSKFTGLLDEEDRTVQQAIEKLEKYKPVVEQPSGDVDGVNKVFVLSYPAVSSSICMFRNGLKVHEFTVVSDTSIEFEDAPLNTGFTDIIEATYIKKPI